MKISFNSIANVISIASGVSLAGIIGVGVTGSLGGGLGGSLPIGAPDLASPTPQAAAPAVPSAGLGIANF